MIDPEDPVITFKSVMEGVNVTRYLDKSSENNRGRDGYDLRALLYIVLFAYMNNVRSTRKIADLCRYDIRFMYLSDDIRPSHMTISTFINECLLERIEDIFSDITGYMVDRLGIDTSVVFIDGTKIEAFPNKYTWVWKKACITSRDRKFRYLKQFFEKLNIEYALDPEMEFAVKDSYSIEELEEYTALIKRKAEDAGIEFVYGKGKRKKPLQRHYDQLHDITDKMKEYAEKISTCGEGRNSYSKTDRDATFMRMKTDYMGNTALLPAYNWQLETAGELILCGLTSQSAADSNCFIPLMEKHKEIYGSFPKTPVTDAGYGTMNTYDFCRKNEMELYMKFPSWKKETHDEKFHNDPFRSVNFKIDEEGNPVCPNGKKFIKLGEVPVKGNKEGRKEERYQCEDCEGCPFRSQCHKSERNRIINLNKGLTEYHKEVIENLASERGIELRVKRSIMAEGTFGIIKQDYNFRRLTRVSLKKVNMEFHLIMIGFNLMKYHNLLQRKQKAMN